MRESLTGGKVKGGILRSHLEYADAQLPGGREALRAGVPADVAPLLDGAILANIWYPFHALVAVDHAILAIKGGDERAAAIDLGRESARLNLGTSYRVYRRDEPHAFFESAARIHRQYLDFGREEYEHVGDTRCRLSLFEAPCYAKVFCWSALGYYEEAVRLQGGRSPQVTESACVCDGDDACRFEISWS